MDDLHKPLGEENASGKGSLPSLIGGFLLLLAIVLGGLWYWSQGDGTVRIALDDPNASGTATNGPSKVVVEVVESPPSAKPPAPSATAPEAPAATKPAQPQAPSFTPEQSRPANAPSWRPDSDLIEASAYGPLPRISDGNLRPLDAYAEPVNAVSASRVAIVVGGMGLSQTGTKQAIEKLPSEITFAFSPTGNSLQRWMEMARRERHETILQLPMEPLGYPAINPGPTTLVSTADKPTNIDNLHRSLARMTNFPVVMNYLGAGLTSDTEALTPILEEVHARGLAWFDDGSAQASRSIEIAQQMRLPHVAGTLVIDAKQDVSAIQAQLKALELLAKRRGFAVGTASAFPDSVDAIAKWAKEASGAGIQIVPLSNLVKDFPRR